MAKKIKEIIDKYTLSIIILFIGVAFCIASFIVPPLGDIDNSVLMAIGEIFSFTAAITGIETYGKNLVLKYKKDKDIED